MLEYIVTKLTVLFTLSGAFLAMPAEAAAVLPYVADFAAGYAIELTLFAVGITVLVALDTLSWPLLTKKK